MHDINFFHKHELAEHDFLGCCKDCRNSLAIIKPHILGFSEKIRHFTHETLQALPLEQDSSLLMIGADAMPKDEIFSYLAQCVEAGTKLSYRIYEKGLRRLLDVQSVFTLPPEFKEYTRIRPEPPVNNTSVFVVKGA